VDLFAFVDVLHRQAGAAFGATTLQNGATSLGGDAGPEAVRPCAVAGMWLVSSFWHIPEIILDFPTSLKMKT